MGAYRAVFLRVHPTGKAVLSLTGDAGGQEAPARADRDERARHSDDDTKVVPQDYDRFGDGHGFLTDGSAGTAERRRRPCAARSATRRSCSRRACSARRRRACTWGNGAWYPGRDPSQGKRIEEIALYAHAGAIELPPGMEGSLDAQTAYRD